MNKDNNKKTNSKRIVIYLGMLGILAATSKYIDKIQPTKTNIENENKNIKKNRITENLKEVYTPYTIDKYYKYIVRNNTAIKCYDSRYIYIFFQKDTYDAKEYIYIKKNNIISSSIELYDLETEEFIGYTDSLFESFNEEIVNKLLEDNYLVCIANINDYIEDEIAKDYYTIKEIKELIPPIKESLIIINNAKNKAKIKTK